jgi:hypothetical protein
MGIGDDEWWGVGAEPGWHYLRGKDFPIGELQSSG